MGLTVYHVAPAHMQARQKQYMNSMMQSLRIIYTDAASSGQSNISSCKKLVVH